MKNTKIILTTLAVLCTASSAIFAANAQIITQTPRPEIPEDTSELIETVRPEMRGNRSGQSVQIPKAGALLFAGFDRNMDYIIDKAEVASGIEGAFAAADRDKSGILSLVELEAWRVAALGSENAAPTNFAFTPDFSRSITRSVFTEVLQGLAGRLDADDQGNVDGKISMADLTRKYSPPRSRNNDDNCAERLRDERRRNQQQCRTGSRY